VQRAPDATERGHWQQRQRKHDNTKRIMQTNTNTTTAHITNINAERFKQAVFFRIKIRRFGNRAKVSDAAALTEYLRLQKEENATAGTTAPATESGFNRVTASKQLIRSEALDNLNAFLSETKEKLVGRFGRATQSNIQAGLFLVRVDNVQSFENDLEEAKTKIALELLPAFESDYDAAIERARTLPVKQGGLGPLFNAADYPSAVDAVAAFEIEWNWLSLSVPENLPAQLRQAAAEKLENQFAEAANEVKLALQEGFQALIAHAAEALKPGEDGAKKIFRNSLTDNIQAFIDSFNDRNVMGDAELAALVSKAREVLMGIETEGKKTADVLRKDATIRQNTAAQFADIAATLGAAIETERSRQFSFDAE